MDLPARFDLREFDALSALPPQDVDQWSVRREVDGTWTLESLWGDDRRVLARGLPRWLAVWLVEAPRRTELAREAVEELLVARELLRAHLRRAQPLTAHQLDGLLDMGDDDWSADVANEVERWLWASGG